MNAGWIKAHRKLLDHPRFKDSEFIHVWLWMLLTATHKPRDVMFQGKRITLKPGQFTAGRLQIAEATGVNESKVKRVLECLKSEQQIDQQTSNACSLFTITNWGQYQTDDQPNGQPTTSQRPASDQPVTTKQEVKNGIMEESLFIALPPADPVVDEHKHCLEHALSIYAEYPLKVGKPAALKAIQKALRKADFETLLTKTKEYAEIMGDDKQFIPNPSTWFNQERWNDNETAKLRKNEAHKRTGPNRNAHVAPPPPGEKSLEGLGRIVLPES